MAQSSAGIDKDSSLAIRAAWLYYAAGLNQATVAQRLGVSSVKAHRLVARATQAGAVKVTIDGQVAECAAVESALAATYGLDYCEVVPDLGEEGLPVRALGIAGASYLRRAIENGQHGVIGVGHGRTLAAVVDQLPSIASRSVQFVSLLGGLTRNFSANPHDVMHRIAHKTGAPAFVMPVPFFANSAKDREILLAQRGVSEVFNVAAQSDLKIVGIGTAEPEASLVSSGMIEPSEIQDVRTKGGVGELLGHFFDADGSRIETALTARTLSIGLEDVKDTRVVAVAGGKDKTCAIRSVLMSGCLSGLITDERTAVALAHLASS